MLHTAAVVLHSSLRPNRSNNPRTRRAGAADRGARRGRRPALTRRISGFAVNPNDRSQYYVAVASGGVWKTVNWYDLTPIFDNEASYSIGYIAMDQEPERDLGRYRREQQPAQRDHGDGVHGTDGGQWRNVGLKTSEHIGKIIVDPT